MASLRTFKWIYVDYNGIIGIFCDVLQKIYWAIVKMFQGLFFLVSCVFEGFLMKLKVQ
jgi:hypothetical protein